MSWLRNSPLRVSFGRRGVSSSPPKDCDPQACFESFKRHWQQAYDIINRTQASLEGPSPDDVLGVVNNLEQLMSLLLLELREPSNSEEQRCLEHLLSENVLERLLVWSRLTTRYNNLRLEQLKLYEMLLSNAPQRRLLTHEPFLRPLLSLLTSCANECFPLDTEKRLILLLNQLCVSLMQNPTLLDLFFTSDIGPGRFIIFGLLIPYVNREGGIGHQARDAMLLCMSLSNNNDALGKYIAEHSNICPVLATGLSGLYSRLPRKLAIEMEDWHRFTPDDVNEMPELTLFLNSLEFCNAVVQVAHPLVQNQMLEFLYIGFLVPVVGPALLKDSEAFSIASSDPVVQRGIAEELVASTAYLDLFLRSITEPGLLQTFLRFLLSDHYDGERVIDKTVQRLTGKSKLCMVSLALFETLVSFNCEDVMLELVFQYLIPCTHVMLSQRKRIRDIDLHCKSAEKFLSLSPSCCTSKSNNFSSLPATTSRQRTLSTTSDIHTPPTKQIESLHGNYCAYLIDAHQKVKACSYACSKWVYPYDGESPEQLIKTAKSGPFSVDNNRNFTSKTRDNAEQGFPSLGESSGYESFAYREESRSSSPDLKSETVLSEEPNPSLISNNSTKDSGSFDPVNRLSNTSSPQSAVSSTPRVPTKETAYVDIFHSTPDIGPFLDLLLRLLENMMNNGLYLNLHLTGLISRLAVFPQPLLSSFLLNHSLVFQPSVRSLFQVLGSLKQRVDSYISSFDDIDEQIAECQAFLVGREERIVNARKISLEKSDSFSSSTSGGGTVTTHTSGSSRRGSTPEPFSRGEPKRRSFSSALSSVFKRATQSAFLPVREHAIEYHPNGYRYTKQVGNAELRRVIMCAVLLDEWLKELAALSQEHVASHVIGNPMLS